VALNHRPTKHATSEHTMQHKLTRLAENVWLWPHHSGYNAIQSSVGIFTGESETVLVDAGIASGH